MQDDATLKGIDADTIETIITTYHPRVGRVVAERWLLPTPVSEAIAFHHDIQAADQNQAYAAIANLTDFLIYHFHKNAQDPERETSASLTPRSPGQTPPPRSCSALAWLKRPKSLSASRNVSSMLAS